MVDLTTYFLHIPMSMYSHYVSEYSCSYTCYTLYANCHHTGVSFNTIYTVPCWLLSQCCDRLIIYTINAIDSACIWECILTAVCYRQYLKVTDIITFTEMSKAAFRFIVPSDFTFRLMVHVISLTDHCHTPILCG